MGNEENKVDERTPAQIATDVISKVKSENQTPPPEQKPPEQKPPEQKPPEQKPPEQKPTLETPDIPPELLGDKPSEQKPPEQKTTIPDEDPEELKNADKRTQEAFHRMRTQLNQANTQLSQQKTATPPPAASAATQIAEQSLQNKKQLDEMNAKLNKAYDEIGKYSLSADPRFKAQYDGPQKATIDSIKEIAKDFDMGPEIIDEALRAGPKKRLEIFNDQKQGADVLSMVSGHLAQYDHVEKMKQMAIDNHKSTRESLETQHGEKSAAMNQAAREGLFKAATMKILKDGHFLFQPIEGNETWNKNVSVLHKKVVDLFSSDDQMAQAESLVLGVTAPIYKNLYEKERTRRIEVEKDMQARYKNKSGLDSTPTDDRDKNKPPSESSAADVVGGILKTELGVQK